MGTSKPISQVALDLGISEEHIECYGKDKAKISLDALVARRGTSGKLILVSGITPTPSGEGKTTLSIGLAQAIASLEKSAGLALRQPSMGPVFGRKGGATGGGMSRLHPSETINLHFTGDFHAISSAHNLLSAAIDNRLHFGFDLDSQSVLWKRVMDMNDRALRKIIVGLGGAQNGVPRESGFDITAASEVMAVLCLSESFADLSARLDRILVGSKKNGQAVTARDIGVTGAMTSLLCEALKPNLVQSTEGVPAFVHGGPFANIAHGCNSVLATKMALSHCDYVVTEAGFAADLGAEKFFDIKCRAAGLNPSVVVLVVTVRALKMHAGVELENLETPDHAAVERGLENLDAHLEGLSHFGKPVVVAINRFSTDTGEELDRIHQHCHLKGVASATADVFGSGGKGARELGGKVLEMASRPPSPLQPLYSLEWPFEKKVETIARSIYGADGVVVLPAALAKLKKAKKWGYDKLPVCMAKTPESLSDNPKLRGRPKGFTISVRDLEIAAGAGFLVALTGDVVRMPGLPERPAAERMSLGEDGIIYGME